MPQRLAVISGDFENQKIGHNRQYFIDRGTFLDCRGPVEISGESTWANCVTIITGSHDPVTRDVVYKPVAVEAKTWICSNVLLYNCRIGEGAIVAAGTVVRSRDVPPWTMVEGNPALAIAEFDHAEGRWDYFKKPRALKRGHGGFSRR